jgi:hypothetical protein
MAATASSMVFGSRAQTSSITGFWVGRSDRDPDAASGVAILLVNRPVQPELSPDGFDFLQRCHLAGQHRAGLRAASAA